MKLILFGVLILLITSCGNKNVYYVDAVNGNDSNKGYSSTSAWASLEKGNALKLMPGSKILLATGSTFLGTIILENVSGTKENPIIISSYKRVGKNERPVIDSKGFAHGILLKNCSHILISNIEITGSGGGLSTKSESKQKMRCGVLVTTSESKTFENIQLKNLLVREIFFEKKGFTRGKDEVRTANGSQSYGWGIRFINSTEDAIIKDILVENCEVNNVAHTGIKFTGRDKSIHNIKLYNNVVFETGGPGIQMSGVKNGHVKNNKVNYSGSNNDTRKWGRGSGLWTWGSSDIIIENNSFRNANGPGDSAGCHIDFNCNNIIVQYNLSENNAGGFCEILGNNYNCSYRYNISVNDGHRVKGENGAFQEGKIFWLSGYNGNGKKRNGPFNSYFYNNTIYVKKDIVTKIAVDRASSGVLIANNIFYIEGESKAVLGDQYKPEMKGELRVENIVFQNNLYLHKEDWPMEVLIQDSTPIVGNPKFAKAGGITPEDYIAGNVELIKDKGVKIEKIPGDEIGLTIGLDVEIDFFGNEIVGLPDIGAIEISK